MAVTIAVRFPLGRYHATPWDRSVNEGAVEWPPSAWRLLRALVATWYTRWPDLPAPVLDGLLAALGNPPSYRTPRTRPVHTRHYLPDLDHRKGESGRTDLVLDPYLRLDRGDELLVQWDGDLSVEQRASMAKLVELVPYLGRADSICEMRLLDTHPVPDEAWWRPGAAGTQTTRLLSPAPPIRRPILEMSTVDVRKARRLVPPETVWVRYGRSPGTETPRRTSDAAEVEAIRFAVVSTAPLRAVNGILLADAVHSQVARRLGGREGRLFGGDGAATDHRHAHWVSLPDGRRRGARVGALLVWARQGLDPHEVAAIIATRRVSGRRSGRSGDDGYEFRGLPTVDLLLQAVGPISQVAPELCGPARRWHSLTPYLPVRHRKRESLDEYVHADLRTELAYRHLPPAAVNRLDPEDGLSDRWSREFRRYRMAEHMGKARHGAGLRLEFEEEQSGPLLLGQLSHFGYGAFVADSG